MFVFLKKYSLILLPIVIFGFFLINSSQSDENQLENAKENTIVVGLQSGYPPFEFRNSEGQIVGFDIDVAKCIAEKLNKTLVIHDMEFDGEILSLKQGKIDLIISGMNITPGRLKEISMVPYYGEDTTSLSLVFWNKIPEGIKSLEDIAGLPGSIISVQTGSVSESYMSNFNEIETKSFDGALAPLMDVKYGKSLANLVESDVADYLKKKHPEVEVLSVPMIKTEIVLGFGIGIKKENKELFKNIHTVIQELKTSGTLKKLEDQWFKGEE